MADLWAAPSVDPKAVHLVDLLEHYLVASSADSMAGLMAPSLADPKAES